MLQYDGAIALWQVVWGVSFLGGILVFYQPGLNGLDLDVRKRDMPLVVTRLSASVSNCGEGVEGVEGARLPFQEHEGPRPRFTIMRCHALLLWPFRGMLTRTDHANNSHRWKSVDSPLRGWIFGSKKNTIFKYAKYLALLFGAIFTFRLPISFWKNDNAYPVFCGDSHFIRSYPGLKAEKRTTSENCSFILCL